MRDENRLFHCWYHDVGSSWNRGSCLGREQWLAQREDERKQEAGGRAEHAKWVQEGVDGSCGSDGGRNGYLPLDSSSSAIFLNDFSMKDFRSSGFMFITRSRFSVKCWRSFSFAPSESFW